MSLSTSEPNSIINIGPRQRRIGRNMGIVALVASVALAVALVALEIDRYWRLSLFLPIWIGGAGIFQARAKT